MAKRKNNRTDIGFDSMILSESSPFAVKEAYKALRTNINFSLPDTDSKVIGFTSSDRSEGKSSTAVNTAISLAQIGKRVILVDCDMRRPSVASKLGVKGRPGLSDLLVGAASLTDCMRKTGEPTLDVMVAGSIPPDPTGLLESKQIGALIEKMRDHYDYVVIDLPPINTVTDAAILAKHIDGFLLVVRHNSTEFRQVEEMLKLMGLADAKILGFVYNDAPISDKGNYAYYG